MLRWRWLLCALVLAFGCDSSVPPTVPGPSKTAEVRFEPPEPKREARFAYPSSRVEDVEDVLHGVKVPDPYRWLEDPKQPEVQTWMSEQDAFARKHLGALELRNSLRKRFAELAYVGSKDAPFRRGDYFFWLEVVAGQEKSVVYVRNRKEKTARAILDPNSWSKDGTVALGSWYVSRNGKTIAYQVRKNAADEATLEFVDVPTGKKHERDTIEGAKYTWDLGWAKNDDGVYYTWVPPEGSVPTADRPGHAEIRFHALGTDPKKDPTVRPKTGDAKTFVYATSGYDSRWLFYVIRYGWVSRDVYVLDMHDPKAAWKPFVVGKKANYYPSFAGDKFLVRTDEDAPNGRLFDVDPKNLDRAAWKELVPEDPKRPLLWSRYIGGRLALGYFDDVKTRIEIRDRKGKLERLVELPELGTASISGRYDEDEAYLWFTTFTQPAQIFKTSVARGGQELYSEVKVPFDPKPFMIEQVFAKSKDGTRVPAFVVRARDAKLDGSAPMLLYGYGGYGSNTTPSYWGSIVPWLERGGIAAFANIRGGGEYGEAWHKGGMRRNKQNVIDDFHAVAEYLVERGYTKSDRLAIRGASNGGLLVGAAITQRPDLYRTALCGVPLLDMVRYHHFGAGKTWIEEFGAAEDPADFSVLFGLSPYHRVKDGTRYPSMLLTTADTDDRVDPMHARKFAAIMQARSTGGPVLLRIEKNAGHGGGDTVKASVEERADSFAFLMNEVGMR